MGSGHFAADLAEEFRRHADIGGDEFLGDLMDDVRIRAAELLVPLFGRQAQVVHQSLAGAHEVVFRKDAEIPLESGYPVEQFQLVLPAEQGNLAFPDGIYLQVAWLAGYPAVHVRHPPARRCELQDMFEAIVIYRVGTQAA